MNGKCSRHPSCAADYDARVRAYALGQCRDRVTATGPTMVVNPADPATENKRLRLQVAGLERLLERRERADATAGLTVLAHRLGLPSTCTPVEVVAAVGAALDRADALAELARQVVNADSESRRALVRMRVALRGAR